MMEREVLTPEAKASPTPLWFGPALLLAAFLLAFGLILWLTGVNTYNEKRNELHLRSASLGETVRQRLKGNLDYLLLLAVERGAGQLDGNLFQLRASQYVKYHPELMNVTWVDAGYVIRNAAPLASNRQIIGLQLDLPEPKHASHLAARTRRPVYTRPFEAIQGKPSFEVWVPVYRGDTFLGLFGGVYSCQELINQLIPGEMRRLYHVSLHDATGWTLGELPATGALEEGVSHSIAVTPSDSGVFLRSSAYRQKGQDWRLIALELLSLGLVLTMAYAMWQLKLEIVGRKRVEEALREQALQLEQEVEERQMAQENLQEQAVLLEEEISDRRTAEEALTRSEEQLRLILDSTGEAIYGIDAEGFCTFCNTACVKMLGYSHPGELLGKDMHAATHHSHGNGAQYPAESCRIRKTVAIGEATHVDDEVLWRADGTCFSAEYWCYPQFKDGKAVGAVITFTNITQRKKLEEQYRQAQKMESIGRLAGGVAHDFNNMLSVILGAAQLAKARVAEGETVLPYLDLIFKAASRSSDITRQLLAFSRKEVVSPKPVNLNSQIHDSEKILGTLISEDIKLSFRPAGELWRVLIDPSQVDQILMNLSVNARDAMPEGGSLTIETRNVRIGEEWADYHPDASPGDYVLLAVSDTGCGMDETTLEHIFEPFFTTKGVGDGTGLGLATVYGIVTQNSGFINVLSELGQGATFEIFLPRLMNEDTGGESPSLPVGDLSGTVLLVEDEDMLLLLATKLLEEIGFTVVQATTPQAAISLCQQEDREIDLILTDVVMPGMNGKEMVERIKTVRPEAKVLFMSGYAAEILAQRGIMAKGMHYVQKPLEMGKLKEVIREVMAEA